MTATTPTLLNHRYRVLQTLGAGGFGETFLALDTQMPSTRRCAIKQLKPMTDKPQFYHKIQERFQLEAKMLEKFGDSCDRIPRLYAYFEEAGHFYLVQEWIKGETLTRRVQTQGILSEAEVYQILMNLLPVLQYIHSYGIIHRDIKPDNIMLRHRDGQPILIDFGAVKQIMGTILDSQGNSASSLIVGTSGFMASEQAMGRPLYSSDLYSLGLTAIYLLTGKIPQELGVDQKTGEIRWEDHIHYLSPGLTAILNKATRFHPRDRYETAAQMLTDLQKLPAPIPPTEPSIAPATQIYRRSPTTPPVPPLMAKSWEFALSSLKNCQNWQKSTVVGLMVGVILGFGFVSSHRSTATSDAQTTVADTQAEIATSCQKSPVSPAFYFLGESAFLHPEEAQEKCTDLVTGGYQEAGVFYGGNYPNIQGGADYKVYLNLFETLTGCEQGRQEHLAQNPQAQVYCGFAQR